MTQSIKVGREQLNGYELAITCSKIQILYDESDIQKYAMYNHYHDYIEMLYISSGMLHLVAGGKHLYAKKGDLVIINAKLPHVAIPCETTSYRVIQFMPQLLYSNFFSAFEIKYMIPFVMESEARLYTVGETSSFPLGETVNRIFEEWDAKQIGYELMLRANILQLFTQIIRHTGSMQKGGAHYAEASDSNVNIIRKILSLDSSTLLGMSCADAAAHCNMSYSYFSRVFKHVTGTCYKRYILQLRINEADRLLTDTDKNITEIASVVGFSSDAYFIQCFHECRGITPKKYREELQKIRKQAKQAAEASITES